MSPRRVHIVGRQNQGKTTLMVELVAYLTRGGVRVGTVKHSGHDHPLDLEGKDSWRHRQAGGTPAAFVTPGGVAVYLPCPKDPYSTVEPLYEGCDIVLVEGDHGAEGVIKVEVFRPTPDNRPPMAADRDDIALVITDEVVEPGAPTCPRGDIGKIARRILTLAPASRGARSFLLAGGQSSRFGCDKARAMHEGKPLLLHAAAALPLLAGEPMVVARRRGQYADLGLETMPDMEPGLGPVGGLATALASLDETAPWALLLPCDAVGLRRRWIEQLLSVPRGGRLAVAFRGDHWQPLPGLYHRDLLHGCLGLMDRGGGALWRLLESANATALPLPEEWGQVIQVNTPGDLARSSPGAGAQVEAK